MLADVEREGNGVVNISRRIGKWVLKSGYAYGREGSVWKFPGLYGCDTRGEGGEEVVTIFLSSQINILIS